jgi:hypothetical protein
MGLLMIRTAFDWMAHRRDKKLAHGAVWIAERLLRWRITGNGGIDGFDCLIEPAAVDLAVQRIARFLPVAKRDVLIFSHTFDPFADEFQRQRVGKVQLINPARAPAVQHWVVTAIVPTSELLRYLVDQYGLATSGCRIGRALRADRYDRIR